MSEQWLPVIGFEDYYDVSSLGRVRSRDREVPHRFGGISIRRGKIRVLSKNKFGYLIITLNVSGKLFNRKVHRMVAECFLPKSSLQIVNHLDSDRTNNAASNLEWTTCKGNQEHASDKGKFKAISNPKCAKKLCQKSVAEIRTERSKGMLLSAIGEKFGICKSTVSKIVNGKTW